MQQGESSRLLIQQFGTSNMENLTEDQINEIQDWADEGQGSDRDYSRYPALSYEDGIRDMCQVLLGDMSVEELLE